MLKWVVLLDSGMGKETCLAGEGFITKAGFSRSEGQVSQSSLCHIRWSYPFSCGASTLFTSRALLKHSLHGFLTVHWCLFPSYTLGGSRKGRVHISFVFVSLCPEWCLAHCLLKCLSGMYAEKIMQCSTTINSRISRKKICTGSPASQPGDLCAYNSRV